MGSTTSVLDELKKLPSEEKLQIIDDLWRSIPPEDVPVDEAVLDEMDRRFEDYLRNPERAVSWEVVEGTIRSKLTSQL